MVCIIWAFIILISGICGKSSRSYDLIVLFEVWLELYIVSMYKNQLNPINSWSRDRKHGNSYTRLHGIQTTLHKLTTSSSSWNRHPQQFSKQGSVIKQQHVIAKRYFGSVTSMILICLYNKRYEMLFINKND